MGARLTAPAEDRPARIRVTQAAARERQPDPVVKPACVRGMDGPAAPFCGGSGGHARASEIVQLHALGGALEQRAGDQGFFLGAAGQIDPEHKRVRITGAEVNQQ